MSANSNDNKSISTGKKFLSFIGRFFIWLFTTLLVLVLGIYVMDIYICKGPSSHFRDLFVSSAMESSVGGVLPMMVLPKESIDAILSQNRVEEIQEETDTSLIHFESAKKDEIKEITTDKNGNLIDPDNDGIDVFEVHGTTYSGKMMIVYDPSRVKVGICNEFSLEKRGLTLSEICEKYDAVAGINGGKYNDEAGLGTGAMPEGIVISDSKLLMGEPGCTYAVYGFTNDNVLVVGNMTPEKALSIGVRDAVSFGPALIVNGQSAQIYGSSSGLNPRTAIGQREDGAVLFLVIEGRQSSSIGASIADLISIMEEYEAVNACNLDGGMSSTLYYNGKMEIQSCSYSESRTIPTAFIVTK